MNITAAMVKELRERTGSGMMECKKALVETGGDLELAIEQMRKSGLAKADKKASRIAAEGSIFFSQSADGKTVVMLEVNCETDFVAKGNDFNAFAASVGSAALASKVEELDALMRSPLASGGTLEQARVELVAKIGENINVRRFVRYQSGNGFIGSYLHGSRIGVLVQIDGGDELLGKDIAMHIAASRPEFIAEADVSEQVLKREKEIYSAQAGESGKPADIIEKMVQGRLKKFLGEITLLGQPFVKDPDLNVGKLLRDRRATVVRFDRFEVGEGIAKKTGNFAEEVMAQVKGH
ncbi:MAG: translation elongation factor Ts [Methylococcaceae bacterium]|nr:translation elongation factor Ts [Methylococcaceae bacterium]